MKKITKAGVYRDLDKEDYFANAEWINNSRLKRCRKSLSLFKYFEDNPPPERKEVFFDFGKTFETALLYPDQLLDEVAIMDEDKWIAAALKQNPKLTKPKSSKVFTTLKDQWEVENEGRSFITTEDMSKVEQMVENCKKNKVINSLISVPENEIEVSIFYVDETGVKLKSRTDVLNPENQVIIDVKSTEDASPENFARSCAQHDYPWQATTQIKAVESAGLFEVNRYFWLVVEKQPPFNAQLYEFQQADREHYRAEVDYHLSLLAEAQKSQIYKGYEINADNPHGILSLDIPLYYRK